MRLRPRLRRLAHDVGAVHRFVLRLPPPLYRALFAASVASWLVAWWLFLVDCYPSPAFWLADAVLITVAWVSHAYHRMAHGAQPSP